MAPRRAPAARPRGPRRSATAVAGTLVVTLLALLGVLVPAVAATGPGQAPPPPAATGDRDPGPYATGPYATGPYADRAASARSWRDAPGERHSPLLDAATASARTALTCPRSVTPRPSAAGAAPATAQASPCRGRAPPSSPGS
ncbi:hypothetical protein PV350_01220 [Streptomyces sp. PA03-6a]|nr:hypothetical protein [Streptomyces sp. PA03-6a]